MWQGVQKQITFHQHYQTPSKNKVKVFQCFISGKCFQEKLKLRHHNGNIHQSIRRCTMSFHIEIKHPDPNLPFPEWSCEISKEPYPHSRALKGHIKWVHKTKTNNVFCMLGETMYKTKYTLARHTNSEEYLKVKTKLKWKI